MNCFGHIDLVPFRLRASRVGWTNRRELGVRNARRGENHLCRKGQVRFARTTPPSARPKPLRLRAQVKSTCTFGPPKKSRGPTRLRGFDLTRRPRFAGAKIVVEMMTFAARLASPEVHKVTAMSVEPKADSATVDSTTACSDLTQPALVKSARRASDSRFNGRPDATKRRNAMCQPTLGAATDARSQPTNGRDQRRRRSTFYSHDAGPPLYWQASGQ